MIAAVRMCVCVCERERDRERERERVQSCLTLCDPMNCIAHQVPLSMEFSRQEYWSGLPFPTPGNLPHPGTKPTSLASPVLAGRFFTTGTTWDVSMLLLLLSRFSHVRLCATP